MSTARPPIVLPQSPIRKPAEAPAVAIIKGLLALGVLGIAWYFIFKGDKAFEEAANKVREVPSYRVQITNATARTVSEISVSCPGRFKVRTTTPSGVIESIVIGGQAYAKTDETRWIAVPDSLSGLPALALCPGAQKPGMQDLPGLLNIATKARIDASTQTSAAGQPCKGWQALPRGPNPSATPLLKACVDEKSQDFRWRSQSATTSGHFPTGVLRSRLKSLRSSLS